jgi:hypothetical protein
MVQTKDKSGRIKRSAPLHPKEPKLTHRRGIGEYALEAVMIALSILLALGVENWNEHRKEAKRCRTALAYIRKEIVQNRREVADLLDKHKARMEALTTAAKALKSGKERGIRVEIDTQFPIHQSRVFDAAMANRTLSPLGYETLLPVMESYSSHIWLQKLEDTWLRKVIESDPDGDKKTLARLLLRLAGIMQNYRLIEEGTIAEYDTATTAIDRMLAKGE